MTTHSNQFPSALSLVPSPKAPTAPCGEEPTRQRGAHKTFPWAGTILVAGATALGAAGIITDRVYDAATKEVMRPAAQNQYFFDPKLRHMENLDIPYTVRLFPSADRAVLVSMQAKPNGDGSFDLTGQSRDELGIPHTTEISDFRPRQELILRAVPDGPPGAK